MTNVVFVNSQLSFVDPRQATVGKVLSLISSFGSHDSLFLIVWILLQMVKQQVSRQFYSGDHYVCEHVCVYMSLLALSGTNLVLYYILRVCVCVCYLCSDKTVNQINLLWKSLSAGPL